MKKYIAKRLLSVLPILFIVSLVVFALVHLAPGSPAAAMLGSEASMEDIAALEEQMGLNDPISIQDFRWLGGIVQGDFGTSTTGDTVANMIREHFLPTINVALFAMLISLAIALPLGMLAARKRGSLADGFVSVFALAGVSVPSFLLGLGLMMLFSVQLRWLPVSGYTPWSGGAAAHLRSIAMPAVALGFMYTALMMRMTRSSMLEVLNSDYIRMAKAKGVSEAALVGKHAFRNALVNIVTVIGQSFIGALSGAAVVETVFGVPGLGQLIINSIGRRDYEVIQAVVLLVALINVLINLLTDLLYGLIDPRIRVS